MTIKKAVSITSDFVNDKAIYTVVVGKQGKEVNTFIQSKTQTSFNTLSELVDYLDKIDIESTAYNQF